MTYTKLRQLLDRDGQLLAFVPEAQSKFFVSREHPGRLDVTSMSFSLESDENWIRGWMFIFRDSNGKESDPKFLDEDELPKVKELLSKSSDTDAEIGYLYRSLEGIVFQKFMDVQCVKLAFGSNLTSGIEEVAVVEAVFAFMESSKALWE